MSYEKRSFIENKYPPVTSDFWNPKAEELWQQYTYFDEASQDLRTNIWPECMRGYLARFDLPENEGLDWPSNSDQHETDLWDATNFHSDAILNAVFTRDGNYMEMLGQKGEDQSTLNAIRDLMLSIHRRADLRGQYGKHIKQMLIYGTSAIWWQWLDEWVYKSFGPAETARRLQEEGITIDPQELTIKRAKDFQFLSREFVGPVVRTIDMYDLWLDPAGELTVDRDTPLITRFYLTPEALENSLDEDGEPKFGNLDGIEPQTLEQIFQKDSGERLNLMQDLGISPAISEGPQGKRLVPVYLFHQPVRSFEDKSKFVNTFFYVAECTGRGGSQKAKVIRVESNPHRNGKRGIYVDSYIDAPGQVTYGIGAIEKSLKAWQSKCVVAELGLAAQIASVFPAYLVRGGSLQDDNELKIAGGSFTVVKDKSGQPLSEIMQPIPAPIGTVALGQSVEQWYGQKILGQFGSLAQVAIQDPTKSIKSEKTATQINVESTTGSVMRDAIIEKLSIRSVEPLLQDFYDEARLRLNDPTITYERMGNDGVSVGSIARETLDMDRRVIATGYKALINKSQEIEQLQMALQTMAQGNAMELNPNFMLVYQEALFDLLGKLGMKNLDKIKQDPTQILLQNPQIQQQLLQLAQDPVKLQQMIAQASAPQGQPPQNDQQQQQPPANPAGPPAA
jgi:hypothetical protein